MDVYLRQQDAPNGDLTLRSTITIPNSRQDFQFAFTPSSSGRVAIEMDVAQPNSTIWIDDVTLQEADITQTNPDDYIVFAYNPSTSNMQVSIPDGDYYDATGKKYNNNTVLKSYTSIVLFKDGSNQLTSNATASQSIAVKGSLTESAAAMTTTSSATTDLTWQVDNEKSTATSYDVQRSSDAVHFTSIGTASAKANTASTTYQFKDANPLGGKNYYRIQQNDAKGAGAISSIVVVNNISFKINPNPAKDVIHLMFDQAITAADHLGKEVVIRNTAGVVVKTITLQTIENMNRVDLDVSSLNRGIYVLSITSDGKEISKKFIKE